MSGTVILLVVIAVTVLLGRYAIAEGHRVEKHKKMSGTVILVIVIAVTVLLGRYAIAEGHRVERQNKMMRDMENWEKKHNKSKPKAK